MRKLRSAYLRDMLAERPLINGRQVQLPGIDELLQALDEAVSEEQVVDARMDVLQYLDDRDWARGAKDLNGPPVPEGRPSRLTASRRSRAKPGDTERTTVRGKEA
jgi:hypothetical protein